MLLARLRSRSGDAGTPDETQAQGTRQPLGCPDDPARPCATVCEGLRQESGRRVRPRHSPYAKGLLITSPGPLIGKNGILARDGIRNSTQRCAAGQDRSAESRDDRPGRGPLAGRPRRGVVASLHRNAGVFAVALGKAVKDQNYGKASYYVDEERIASAISQSLTDALPAKYTHAI